MDGYWVEQIEIPDSARIHQGATFVATITAERTSCRSRAARSRRRP